MKKFNLLLVAVALMVITMSSCSHDNSNPPNFAHVMYFNGCLGIGGDGSLVATVNSVAQENGAHIQYNSFLTGGYQNLISGNSMDFAFTNANIGSSLTAGISVSIATGSYYTVFAGGEVGSATTVPYVFITTDVFPTPSSGVTSIRCVNLSPYSDSTQISPSAGPSLTLGTNIGAASYSSYVNIPSGTYSFYANGSKAASSGLPLSNVSILAGKSYTLIYSGSRFVTSGTDVPTLTLVQNN